MIKFASKMRGFTSNRKLVNAAENYLSEGKPSQQHSDTFQNL